MNVITFIATKENLPTIQTRVKDMAEIKRPVGRPANEIQRTKTTVSIDPNLLMQAKIFAITNKTNVSDVIDVALREYMAKEKAEE